MNVKGKVRDVLSRVVDWRLPYRDVQGVRVGRDVRGFRRSSFEGANQVNHGACLQGEVHVGYGSTIGVGCYVAGPVVLGRWCQLAPYASIYGSNHPTNHLSTYVNPRLVGGVVGRFNDRRRVVVGNDVWLGHGALVLPGVTLGDGAVVGGGSVVTDDVEPFTIVVGNPARPVRRRFSAEVQELITRSRWWDRTEEELESCRPVFEADLDSAAGADLLRRMCEDLA